MVKRLIILGLVVLVLVGGWWVYQKRNLLFSKSILPLQKVSLKIKWLHQAQFAGNYVAVEKGFYEQEGLDVTILPFSFEDTAIKSVTSGESDFGIAGADEVIMARTQGKPVKAIAVIFQTNPVTLYTLKSSGITKPQDLIGKKVGIQKGVNTEYLYIAMMNRLKIDRSKIKEVEVGYGATELLSGEVDVTSGYITDQPQLAIEAGYDINTILMADYGVNMYADVLFTTDEMIQTKPAMVESFLRATLKGWQYAFENQEKAVEITLKYANKSTKAHETYVLATSIPLINNGIRNLGWMERTDWEKAQNILFEQKLLQEKIPIDEVFTMEFLKKIYEKN